MPLFAGILPIWPFAFLPSPFGFTAAPGQPVVAWLPGVRTNWGFAVRAGLTAFGSHWRARSLGGGGACLAPASLIVGGLAAARLFRHAPPGGGVWRRPDSSPALSGSLAAARLFRPPASGGGCLAAARLGVWRLVAGTRLWPIPSGIVWRGPPVFFWPPPLGGGVWRVRQTFVEGPPRWGGEVWRPPDFFFFCLALPGVAGRLLASSAGVGR